MRRVTYLTIHISIRRPHAWRHRQLIVSRRRAPAGVFVPLLQHGFWASKITVACCVYPLLKRLPACAYLLHISVQCRPPCCEAESAGVFPPSPIAPRPFFYCVSSAASHAHPAFILAPAVLEVCPAGIALPVHTPLRSSPCFAVTAPTRSARLAPSRATLAGVPCVACIIARHLAVSHPVTHVPWCREVFCAGCSLKNYE